MTRSFRRFRALGYSLGALLLFPGCSTTVLVRNDKTRIEAAATYSETQHFFFWGLVGARVHDISWEGVCMGQPADQIQTGFSGMNVLYSVITLGIYTPKTVQVWCKL